MANTHTQMIGWRVFPTLQADSQRRAGWGAPAVGRV